MNILVPMIGAFVAGVIVVIAFYSFFNWHEHRQRRLYEERSRIENCIYSVDSLKYEVYGSSGQMGHTLGLQMAQLGQMGINHGLKGAVSDLTKRLKMVETEQFSVREQMKTVVHPQKERPKTNG